MIRPGMIAEPLTHLITEITKVELVERIGEEGILWAGRMEEADLLDRLFELDQLPSNDFRYETMLADVSVHSDYWDDWDDDWVFRDSRLGILSGPDQLLLRFLCETLHPVVRRKQAEADSIVKVYNSVLVVDGFEIFPVSGPSQRSLFRYRRTGLEVPALASAAEVVGVLDTHQLARKLAKINSAVESEPDVAIGTAKELVESVSLTIIAELGLVPPSRTDLNRLVRVALGGLKLTPAQVTAESKTADAVRKVLGSLASVVQGLAELRNHHGTGHGKASGHRGLDPRHARLAAGAAATLTTFMVETFYARASSS